MKLLLILMTITTFNLFASCDEYSLKSLERMDPETEYCSHDDVEKVAVKLYAGTDKVEVRRYTPKPEDVYGDNDGSTLLVVKPSNGKSKYIRYDINYGRCNIIDCSSTGYYRDEI